MTRRNFLTAAFLLCTGADSLHGADAPKPRILCLGDSLTFGVGGAGTTWPDVLARLTGSTTVNRGRSGWIPRHIKYAFLLEDAPDLTADQLRSVPPAEYENRVHQPNNNALRVFYKAGQTVTVRQPDGTASVYAWDPHSTRDGDGAIKPDAVNAPDHKPFFGEGRWLRSPAAPPAKAPPPAYCIIWIGANGMEAGDVSASLHEITKDLPPSTKVLLVGLVNRLPWGSDARAVGEWKEWITECNDRTRKEFPGHLLDLQAWFTSSGPYGGKGFKTRDWTPDAPDPLVAGDAADQARGLVPRSVRGVKETTHFNAAGYTAIAHIIRDTMVSYGWLPKPAVTP